MTPYKPQMMLCKKRVWLSIVIFLLLLVCLQFKKKTLNQLGSIEQKNEYKEYL